MRARDNIAIADGGDGRPAPPLRDRRRLPARTIGERPLVGFAHLFVFWGFVAFAGYTGVEFLAASASST